MKPLKIDNNIVNMTNKELSEKIDFNATVICTIMDFSKVDKSIEFLETFEKHTIEGLMRVFVSKIGKCPKQNKMYEYVDSIYDNQDAYNINRMLSAIRRMRAIHDIDYNDEKYLEWFKNRVKYSAKTLSAQLQRMDAVMMSVKDKEYRVEYV